MSIGFAVISVKKNSVIRKTLTLLRTDRRRQTWPYGRGEVYAHCINKSRKSRSSLLRRASVSASSRNTSGIRMSFPYWHNYYQSRKRGRGYEKREAPLLNGLYFTRRVIRLHTGRFYTKSRKSQRRRYWALLFLARDIISLRLTRSECTPFNGPASASFAVFLPKQWPPSSLNTTFIALRKTQVDFISSRLRGRLFGRTGFFFRRWTQSSSATNSYRALLSSKRVQSFRRGKSGLGFNARLHYFFRRRVTTNVATSAAQYQAKKTSFARQTFRQSVLTQQLNPSQRSYLIVPPTYRRAVSSSITRKWTSPVPLASTPWPRGNLAIQSVSQRHCYTSQ